MNINNTFITKQRWKNCMNSWSLSRLKVQKLVANFFPVVIVSRARLDKYLPLNRERIIKKKITKRKIEDLMT